MSTLALTKRSSLSVGLTNAQEDANKTAIELFINAMLAGTAGYQAGDALKVGGVLPNSFWNNTNCPFTTGVNIYQKLSSGLIIQRGEIYCTTGSLVLLPTTFLAYFSVSLAIREPTSFSCQYTDSGLTGFNIYHNKGSAATFGWLAIGR